MQAKSITLVLGIAVAACTQQEVVSDPVPAELTVHSVDEQGIDATYRSEHGLVIELDAWVDDDGAVHSSIARANGATITELTLSPGAEVGGQVIAAAAASSDAVLTVARDSAGFQRLRAAYRDATNQLFERTESLGFSDLRMALPYHTQMLIAVGDPGDREYTGCTPCESENAPFHCQEEHDGGGDGGGGGGGGGEDPEELYRTSCGVNFACWVHDWACCTCGHWTCGWGCTWGCGDGFCMGRCGGGCGGCEPW
jgi:hypothetical protein